MKRIRVLRVLEYIYQSVEAMEADMAKWAIHGQLNPLRSPSAHASTTTSGPLSIKSTTFPLETLADEPVDAPRAPMPTEEEEQQ